MYKNLKQPTDTLQQSHTGESKMRTQPRIFSYAPVNVTGKMFGETDVKTPFLFVSFLNRPIFALQEGKKDND